MMCITYANVQYNAPVSKFIESVFQQLMRRRRTHFVSVGNKLNLRGNTSHKDRKDARASFVHAILGG